MRDNESIHTDEESARRLTRDRKGRATEEAAKEDLPLLKKIKQEQIESDTDDFEARKRCISDLYSDSNQFDSDSNTEMFEHEQKNEEEEWQADLRALVCDGEATLEDYSSDCESTLKWIVKHGIRLAITCTKCNLMEHADDSQLMQDHGLSCENKYAGEESTPMEEEDEPLPEVATLPRPIYLDPMQVSLRKSLERHSSWLMNMPDDMKKLPLKFIMGKNGKKRAGMCIFCGDIFLSTDHKKWIHECWLQDNEVNGFLINGKERGITVNSSKDRAANKNPDLLNLILNKTLHNQQDSGENSLSEQRLSTGVRLYDREWAYSIRDRLTRGELKTKPMISDPNYCICYIINSKGIVLANYCQNCCRVFSPSISASNRSRHISVCYLSKIKRKIPKLEREGSAGIHPNSAANIVAYNKTRKLLNIKKARSRKAYILKKMKDTNYNVNLEGIMSKTLASDLLPTEVFYANGMKAFFNRLLKIGFDLGQQPGTVLPSYEDILPSRNITETNLVKFINMDKFRDTFAQVASAIQEVGGTIAVESVGNRNPLMSDNKFLAVSFVIYDEMAPRRLVADLVAYDSTKTIKDSILALLDKNNINSKKCNLFVNKQASELLLEWDKFSIKLSCFGDFLNQLVEGIFEDEVNHEFPEQFKQNILKLKALLDKTAPCFKFLQSTCSISPEVRALICCEFDSRWFVQPALAQKLLFLLKNHSESVLESVLKLEESTFGKKEIIEFIDQTIQQTDNLQQYVKFAQIFMESLEPCSVFHHATLHLVVPKLQLIREQLKSGANEEAPKEEFYQQLCSTTLNIIESLESGFLTKYHFFATLLAPGHRDQLTKYYGEERILEYKNELLGTICAVLSENELEKVEAPQTEANSELKETEASQNDDAMESDKLDQEFERYFEANAPGRVNPLKWWSENEELAPGIATFAKRIFTMPAVSTISDKSLPGHLSSMHISEYLRRRILFNWVAGSELQVKRSTIKKEN